MMDTLTVLQHNVNHWNNKKHELISIYRQYNPDIILINDHTITETQNIKIPYYDTYVVNRTNRQNNRDHRGVAIAIKNNIIHRLLDDFTTDLTAITVETGQGPVTIATDYIPPSATYLNYIDYNSLLNRSNPVYFFGDINPNHPNFGYRGQNPVGSAINLLMSQGKLRHIGPHFPTFLKHNSSTTPDIAFTNTRVFHNIHMNPGPVTSSDHIPVIATITVNPITIPIIPRPQFSRADWDNYKLELQDLTVPENAHPTKADIDSYLQVWTDKITLGTANHIPTLTHRIIPGVRPNNETNIVQQELNDIYNTIATHGPSQALCRRLSLLKIDLRRLYTQQHEQLNNELIANINLESDPKKFFSSIKRLQGNNKQNTPYLRDSGNNKVHTSEDKETLFRELWSNVFQEDSDTEDFDEDHIETVENFISDHSEEIIPYNTGDMSRLDPINCPRITLDELKDTVEHMKHKAPGATKISAPQIKNLPINMLNYLLYILNMCLSMGYFPDTFKHATMIFIPKGKSSQHQVANYRPISLLETYGKIFDKILNIRLTHFLENNSLVNTRQHGFRRNRGTNTALANFYETIANSINNKLKVDIVLRDVSKAFDKVWHTGLKYKLFNTQLHACYIKTLSNYLDNRTASIRIGPHVGPPFPIDTGVPQGGCLSPTLYQFFTHDMPEPIGHTDYIAYADDITQIITHPCNHRYLALQTGRAISQINDFEKQWKIKTNISKFKIINISRRNTVGIDTPDRYYEYTNEGKMLGLNFDTTGFSKQHRTRINIAKNNLAKLQIFRNLNLYNKRRLYNAFVRPALVYPIVPLNMIPYTQKLKMQRVQNQALRFITNTRLSQRIRSETLHNECNIEPLNQHIHRLAKKTWDTMQHTQPELYEQLVTNTPATRINTRFPSSRTDAEGPIPTPIYS